jgi:uncharacterized protein (DUF2267 family)
LTAINATGDLRAHGPQRMRNRRAETTGRRLINRTRKVAHVSTTGLEVFDETLHKTNTWLKEIATALGLDRHGAYQVLRAVLHCLRDRLTINEAAQLGDQLPMLVRGIYYEAWRPAGKPEKIRSRDEFLRAIGARIVMKQSIDPENAARAVFRTLENHVSAGEIRDVMQVLPEDIRALFPPLEAATGHQR